MGFYRIFHPDDTPNLLAAWQEILASKRSREVEGRIRSADGTYRWFMFRQNALLDAEGNVVKWYGVIVEIEDRKHAEDALKEAQSALQASEQNLRLIIDSLPVLVWSARPDGSADFINQSWLDYAGVPADQILDWGFLDFYHPDDIPGMVEIWKHDLEHSDRTVLEGRIRGAHGEYRRFLFSGRKLTDANGVVRWFGCNVDIEDLQRAQDALREREAALTESERKLNLIINTMPAAIWSSAPDGMVDFFNQHFLDFVGLPHEEVAGQGFYRMFHPDDLDLMASTWNRITATRQAEEVDGRIKRFDGEYRWFTLRQSPLLDSQGNVVKWYGIVLDIEDRKRAEDELRRSEADLAHMSRVTTLGELAVSIAHEINQPLMAIVTNAGTCLRWLDMAHFDSDLARQAAQRIVEDGHRAGDIITSIRALAHKSPVRMEPMNLQQAIREVLLVLNGELRRRGVDARSELVPESLMVLGDRTQLQQVLLNLVMNGVEAMTEAQAGRRHLTIRSAAAGDGFARVAVLDSGPGLQAAHFEKIFDAFFSTKQGGLGMGLSICRSIIEAHGGSITASNNAPSGSIFSFTVPLAKG
jgi:PAS domain S-box-containing protein